MEFCEKCGSLMLVEKKRKHTFLVCKKCGWKKKLKGEMAITETIVPEKKEVVVMKKAEEELPKTKIICPKCGHDEAYWYMQQTRGGDEPPTLFYTCVKCGHSWRSYG
jgi:DNA-directed RNA polymerase subunit M